MRNKGFSLLYVEIGGAQDKERRVEENGTILSDFNRAGTWTETEPMGIYKVTF